MDLPGRATPAMYGELATWFPLLSPPAEYAEESAVYRERILTATGGRARMLLELGAGAGSNASHLKHAFRCTLTDLSPDMLAVSSSLNPGCEHVAGDMRALRLGRTFDAVLIHDAIGYMTTEADLARAIETAWVHCSPGGALVVAPDHVRETFEPSTDHGGSDLGERGLRYLEWVWDPDPDDLTFVADYALLLRTGTEVRAVHDRHVEGLFPLATWRRTIERAGFRLGEDGAVRYADGSSNLVFVAVKP